MKKKVVAYRKFCGLTQKDIASYLGLSVVAYNAKENGRTAFSSSDMQIIKTLLSEKLGKELTVDELFFD